MFNEVEYETVEIKLPKGILEFLRALRVSIEEYLENTVVEGFKADLNASSGPFMENIHERFPELKRLFEGSP